MAIPLPVSFAKELPSVWRADELAHPKGDVLASGFGELDALLPGGGWPVGGLVEILQAQSGQNEWRLLLPGLVASPDGPLVLVGAPHTPFGPGLAGQGLDPQRLLCINTATPSARLWAAEQALRCKPVTAVLAWLPLARADQLRRLQMGAADHAKLLFVVRPAQAQNESSPAVLRLLVGLQAGSDALVLRILKRRGPPVAQDLVLQARATRLSALLAVSGEQIGHGLDHRRGSGPVSGQIQSQTQSQIQGQDHALDRLAVAA